MNAAGLLLFEVLAVGPTGDGPNPIRGRNGMSKIREEMMANFIFFLIHVGNSRKSEARLRRKTSTQWAEKPTFAGVG